MTKLKLDFKNGVVEVEGSEDLAAKIYADFKQPLLDQSKKIHHEPAAAESQIILPPSAISQLKNRAASKSSGPSCADRIIELKDAGYFKNLRDLKSIGSALSERAHNYQSNQIGAALTGLIKRGVLRRINKDGGYQYQNP